MLALPLCAVMMSKNKTSPGRAMTSTGWMFSQIAATSLFKSRLNSYRWHHTRQQIPTMSECFGARTGILDGNAANMPSLSWHKVRLTFLFVM